MSLYNKCVCVEKATHADDTICKIHKAQRHSSKYKKMHLIMTLFIFSIKFESQTLNNFLNYRQLNHYWYVQDNEYNQK